MYCVTLFEAGRGPPVVFVPGIDGTGRMLLGQAELLARRFRLVSLRYLADDDPSSDTYVEMARSLVAALDRVGIERAILLAESFGGGVALECAVDHPARVAALALVNTFPYFPRRLRLAASRLAAPLVPAAHFHRGRTALAPSFLFGALREDAALRRFREEGGQWFDQGYRRRLGMVQRLDLRNRLGEVRQPVTLFAGDRDRIVPSARQLSRLCEQLGDAESVIIRGGGHLVLPLEGLPWSEWLLNLVRRADLGCGE